MIIEHDHPYSRPSYLDPISTLCIEPVSKSNDSGLCEEGTSYTWVDVVGDETKFPDQMSAPPINENACQFTRFCTFGPIEEPKCNNKQLSYT